MSPAPDGEGRTLVLGYDRRDGARRAAEWAAAQLQPEGKLVIVHALRGLHTSRMPLMSAKERGEFGRAVVDELLLEGQDSMRDLELEVDVLDEDPVHALIAAARRHAADAIVIGSEPHSRVRRALGDTTSELLTSSPVPVVVVPPGI